MNRQKPHKQVCGWLITTNEWSISKTTFHTSGQTPSPISVAASTLEPIEKWEGLTMLLL